MIHSEGNSRFSSLFPAKVLSDNINDTVGYDDKNMWNVFARDHAKKRKYSDGHQNNRSNLFFSNKNEVRSRSNSSEKHNKSTPKTPANANASVGTSTAGIQILPNTYNSDGNRDRMITPITISKKSLPDDFQHPNWMKLSLKELIRPEIIDNVNKLRKANEANAANAANHKEFADIIEWLETNTPASLMIYQSINKSSISHQ